MHIRPFEIALIGIFALLGLGGLFYLSGYDPAPSDNERLYGQSVVIWGTLDGGIMNDYIIDLSRTNKALEVVQYTEIDPRTFDNDLLNAIAEGRAPDLVIMPHSLLVTYRTKLFPIDFDTMSQRDFRDAYIDGAEIFMMTDGTYGIPFAVDPLVMYWNRNIFSSGGLASPPTTWEALVSQTTPALVRKNDQLELTQSAVSFGEFVNVQHAKEIIAMLFMQAGNNIVEERQGGYAVTIDEGGVSGLPPGEAVLSFYTQFTNPSREVYSWNRSKRLDRTEFLNGTLAMYVGSGSERRAIELENPNLNFDVALIPQGSGVTTRRGYGEFYAFTIPRTSKNISGAYAVAHELSRAGNVEKLIERYDFAPVQRSLYTGSVGDPFKDVIYQSALIARGWLDPAPRESAAILRNMIEQVTASNGRYTNVIIDAVYQLESLF